MLNALRSWLATQPAKPASLTDALRDEVFLDGTVKLLRDPDEISQRLAELYDCPNELQLWSEAGISEVSGCLVAPEHGKQGLKLRVRMLGAPQAGQSINLAYARRRSGLCLVDTRLLSAKASSDGQVFNLELAWPETLLVNEMRHSPRFRATGMSSASWQLLIELLGCSDRSIVDNVAEGGLGLRLSQAQAERLEGLSYFSWQTLGILMVGDEALEFAVTSIRMGAPGFYLVGCKFVASSATWQREWRRRLMKAQATQLLKD
jgi:hypothetical protein